MLRPVARMASRSAAVPSKLWTTPPRARAAGWRERRESRSAAAARQCRNSGSSAVCHKLVIYTTDY